MSSPKDRRRARPKTSPKDQLPWWYDLFTSTVRSPLVDHHGTIYTNRTLPFAKIKAIGFDFDHTLAIYNCAELDGVAMQLVIDRLIEHEGVASNFTDNLPDPSFAGKGLIVDTQLGNVLKPDRYGFVTLAYHGTRRLTSRELRECYENRDIIGQLYGSDRFVQVDSAFAKPEVLIFSALAPGTAETEGGCQDLWKTIRHHTDMIHRDGSLKSVLTKDPLRFVRPELETVGMLRRLKEGGKKVFLLTNSEWEYTSRMIGPAFGISGSDPKAWLNLFDHVVVEGRKPHFFGKGQGDEPEQLDFPNVTRGGGINHLEGVLGCSGPEVMYVGDHIYADLISSKRTNQWRTMLILAELDDELNAHAGLPGMAEQLLQTDDRRTHAEREVMHWKSIQGVLKRMESESTHVAMDELKTECRKRRDEAAKALKSHIAQRRSLQRKIANAVNPYWGSLFRTDAALTWFGRQLEDYACTYTSRAINLGLYPPDHYFRSAMDYLPHELESM